MQKKKLFYNLTAMCLAACILASCGSVTDPVKLTESKNTVNKTAMLDEYDISYEVPVMRPLISVAISGYELTDKKIAIIAAENLPARFEVISCESGESVYTGNVKKINTGDNDNLVTGQADFSDLKQAGTYYIQADIVGCSEKFTIVEDAYSKMLKDAFSGLDSLRCGEGNLKCHSGMLPLESNPSIWIDVSGGWHTGEDGQKDVVEGCVATYDLMLAYEYFNKSFRDDIGIAESGNGVSDILDEIMYEAEWLMKMQNPQTGGVYTSVSLQKLSGSDNESLAVVGETTKATAYFCATMARLSYLTNSNDQKFAGRCMKAANLAWKCLESNREIVSKDQLYRASVEMYRANGYRVYQDHILDYLKDNSTGSFDTRLSLDAAISYLDTPRYTEKTYCDNLMAQFMDKTESHANAATGARYLVEPGDKNVGELLRNACELAIVDYIISSSAYVGTEKNYLQYIGGRNKDSINYLVQINNPDSYAELIIILGRILGK